MDYPELLKGYKNELVKLQEVLMKERENRENDEVIAIEMLTKVKEQYDIHFNQMKSDYEDKIKELEQQITQQIDERKNLEDKLNEEHIKNQHLSENEQRLKDQQRFKDEQNQQKNEKSKDDQIKKQEIIQEQDLNQHKKNNYDEKLESKLIELQDLRRKVNELEISVNHKDIEISNLKLDLRFAKRETASNQEDAKILTQSNLELKKKLTKLENELKQVEFKDTGKESEMKSLKGMYEECQKKNEQLQEKIKSLEDDKQKLTEDIINLKVTIKSKDDLLNNSRTTNMKLKKVCEQLEIENEKLNEKYEEELYEREKNMVETSNQLKKIQSLTAELENYKNKLDLAEQQIAKTIDEYNLKESNLEKDTQRHLDRISELEAKLNNEIDNNTNYMEEIKKLEADCFNKDTELAQYLAKINNLTKDLNLIKEERSKYLTVAEDLKSQNHSIAKMYDDLCKNFTIAKSRIKALYDENDQRNVEFERKKLIYEDTINQQRKAIDHLNKLVDEETNKVKKNWFSNFRTESKSPAPVSTFASANKIKEEAEKKENESALEREKQKNKVLMEQIGELEKKLKKRKNENNEEIKKVLVVEHEPATAPSFSSNDPNDLISDFDSKKNSSNEEEFTFTDSMMEELAYKDC